MLNRSSVYLRFADRLFFILSGYYCGYLLPIRIRNTELVLPMKFLGFANNFRYEHYHCHYLAFGAFHVATYTPCYETHSTQV